MESGAYFLFVCASVVLCIVPGPDMIFIFGQTLAKGRKAGVMAAIGINAGAYVHLLGAVVGLSAVLAASAFAFTIVKWIGAVYLVYLGVKILLSKSGNIVIDGAAVKQQNKFRIFWQGFLSDVLNPKVAIFYLAFLPQFVDPLAQHQTLQIFFLGLTTNVVAIIINLVLVYFAGFLAERLGKNLSITRWLNKMLGLVFVALGFRLAQEKL